MLRSFFSAPLYVPLASKSFACRLRMTAIQMIFDPNAAGHIEPPNITK